MAAGCSGPTAGGRAGEPAGLDPLVLLPPPGAAVAGAAAEGDASCRAYCPRVGVTCGPAGLAWGAAGGAGGRGGVGRLLTPCTGGTAGSCGVG